MTDQSGEPNLYAFLQLYPDVVAQFGTRIFHQRAKNDTRGDYVVWQRAGGSRQPMFCGQDDTVGGEYQIDIYSRNDVAFVNGQRAIRRAMLDDSPGQKLAGAVLLEKVLLENDFDSVDPDPGLYRRTQLYTVWYAEG